MVWADLRICAHHGDMKNCGFADVMTYAIEIVRHPLANVGKGKSGNDSGRIGELRFPRWNAVGPKTGWNACFSMAACSIG